MSNRSFVGRSGEDVAATYLIELGHRILERNKRYPWGELDIVSLSLDKTLVITEVKAIKKSQTGITPKDNMTFAKLDKLKRAAIFYANENQNLYDARRGWRIDFISIIFPEGFSPQDNLTSLYKNCELEHIENVS